MVASAMDGLRGVVAAVAAVVCAVCISLATSSTSSKYNILTITNVNFDDMLGDPRYEQWFRDNLRCDQRAFCKIVVWLRRRLPKYSRRRSVHSFEKKVAVFLYFLGSEGGYRETAGAFGMARSWCVNVVSTFVNVVSSNANKWIHFPMDSRA
ncbi:hypothetical protein H257_04292 [Aphanomyces astaci]|uniref:DDE Tnp4 domain-containing protein n=1 Tax=Aphanomyces astaci TaxID=112090 RepID=W4GV59_APHAT|nr:hypothetical protein H257_04292 [Aphanomyces astaci]ETV83595.1 hypothetical protein H257_04292 [Aphanomyces astaci]|eukprot:XP_009827025.1 hypothetical protein H257_04292 [Aphanomyces astaci]